MTVETEVAALTTAVNSLTSTVNVSKATLDAAADKAVDAYDSFDDRYLGVKNSAPANDNDGGALLTGALYFNSTSNTMFVFTGSAWAAVANNNIINPNVALTQDLATNGNDVKFGDNDKATFGTSDDLQIFHDPAAGSVIQEGGAGSLFIRASSNIQLEGVNGENMAIFNENGSVQLYHDNSEKLSTTATGIDVTGTATMDGLTVGTNSGGIITLEDTTSIATAGQTIGAVIFKGNDGSHPHAGTKAQIKSLITGSLGDGADLTFTTSDQLTNNITRLHIADSGDISFYEDTGTTPKFFWDASAESLGIGTSSPRTDYALDVQGVNDNGANIQAGNAASDIALSVGSTSTADKFVVLAGGNVGINTSSPADTLDISAIGTSVMRFSDSSSPPTYAQITQANGVLTFAADAGNAQGGSNMQFEVDGAEAMRIDSSGNLLVGTTDSSVYNNSANSTADNGFNITSSGQFYGAKSGAAVGILNRTSSDGDILQFNISGTAVGSIGTVDGDLNIYPAASGHKGLRFGNGYIAPTSNNISIEDATTDLGLPAVRFKDLRLSGGVYLGGTGAANLLDDYEEGTFTATINGSSEPATLKTVTSYYTKVGEKVHFQIAFENIDTTGYAGDLSITGLPFTARTLRAVVNVVHYNTTTWSTSQVPIAIIGASATSVQFLNQLSGGSWTVNQHNAGTGRYLWITGTYITAA